jgi:hypothetical protein
MLHEFSERLRDAEAEAAGSGNFQTARNPAQLCDVFLFEVCHGHVHLRVKRECG